MPIINQACIHWDGIRYEHVKWQRRTSPSRERGRVRPNDLLINSTGTGTLGRAAVMRRQGQYLADSHVTIVRTTREADPQFLRYVLQTSVYQGYLYSVLAPGATNQIELSRDGLRRTPFPMPPLEEQRAIAAFLDRKTAAIDALIAKKERLIELLREERQAQITQAVTRGLRSKATMKKSGDNWLGHVPEHWKKTRLGFVSVIGNGSTPSREDPGLWDDSGFPWLNSAKVNDETVPGADRFVTARARRECHLPCVAPGTLLMAITGEGQTRGRVALLTFEATISQHLAFISPSSDVDPGFLLRHLQARYEWLRTESSGGGSTKAALTCEFLRTITIALPPLPEQRSIVEHLRRCFSGRDEARIRLIRSVEKLREYRQALITAAVTGKIDVSREAAA